MDLKKIAKMQIGGPKYPDKKRINLYQREVKKGAVAGQIVTLAAFLVFLYGFSQVGIVMPMERADRAEAAYQRMEAQLEVMKQANSIMPEVKTEYAHYGNSWRNDQEAVMPDRLVMLDVLKNTIFPICKTIETVSVTDDQMNLECTLERGTMLKSLIQDIEEDGAVRYVTASLEETEDEDLLDISKRAEDKVVRAQVTVYFMRRERVRTYHEILNELCSDKKRKAAIVVLLLLILLTAGMWGLFSHSGTDRSSRYHRSGRCNCNGAGKVSKDQIHAAEIQENKDADAPVVPSYNNFKEELEELNRIHGQAYDFLFTFNEPEVNGTNIRRSVTVNCSAEDYDAAVEMMREILQGPYRSLIYNISMDSVSAVDADFEPNIKEGRVELTFNMNYFETTEGAESLEGLQVEETQAASGGGLANSDMSNLQRSDLETAAEAAFGE